MIGAYKFSEIERKWQHHWETNKTFKAEDNTDKPKFYALDMFPYPSGAGLHVGHPEGYIATDIMSRYKRMKGFEVLHPMGWDAFGLPAEQYAIETGTHPREKTAENIQRFKGQLSRLGFSYDWDREVNTTDPNYYKWTQWIFTTLYEKGLAYMDEIAVNWCPALGTVLANEEVINGRSERGDHPVERRPMRQWMLKITEYAEKLLEGLDDLDWPEGIKEMQRNWIGRSEGAEVKFQLTGCDKSLTVFTTRPDTLFGATYMVLAPEHPFVQEITAADRRADVEEYVRQAANKNDMERTELAKEKTGVFTGATALNPVNNKEIPIWISDYVLITYGTGAIMAVPAHDTRDFEFARKFEIPINCIIDPSIVSGGPENISECGDMNGCTPADFQKEDFREQLRSAVLEGRECWTGDGTLVNSSDAETGLDINGLNVNDAVRKTTAWLQERDLGRFAVNYKLRDWLFSRQRYWGEPFPVVHMEDGTIKILDEDELPLTLPEVEDFRPAGTGESSLARAGDWLDYSDPKTGKKGRRETNTMPQWAGSCWYYLRYIDPHNPDRLVDPEKEKYWMPVDLYVGGAEHAVLHLLYARFWHKVLYDAGIVATPEPFGKLVNQGMILGTSYKDGRGALVPNDKVNRKGAKFFHAETGEELVEFPAKMSKSLKNVVNPDDIIEQYGADSMRLYEMFMGPLEAVKPWKTEGVDGVFRFLKKLWRLVVDEETGSVRETVKDVEPERDDQRILHQTIWKVTEDIENMAFNTAISQMMICLNHLSGLKEIPRDCIEKFIQILSPLAPHICEELWERLGHTETLVSEPWPEYDKELAKEDEIEIAVQIKGKVKSRITVSADISKEDLEKKALEDPKIKELIEGKEIRKVITVPGSLVNIVAT